MEWHLQWNLNRKHILKKLIKPILQLLSFRGPFAPFSVLSLIKEPEKSTELHSPLPLLPGLGQRSLLCLLPDSFRSYQCLNSEARIIMDLGKSKLSTVQAGTKPDRLW